MKNIFVSNYKKIKFIVTNIMLLTFFIVSLGFVSLFCGYNDSFAIINSAKSLGENFILYKNTENGNVAEKYFTKQQLQDFFKDNGVVPQRLYETSFIVPIGNSSQINLTNFIETSNYKNYNLNIYNGGRFPSSYKQGEYEQILISDYYADILLKNGYTTLNNQSILPKDYNEILNNPIFCEDQINNNILLQITGIYKTNYKQYQKYENSINDIDMDIYAYNHQYIYNTIYTSVGFSDRHSSTIKSLYTNIFMLNYNNMGTIKQVLLTNGDAKDDYEDYLKIFSFSNQPFEDVLEGEIVLPVSIFNEYFLGTSTEKYIDAKTLFEQASPEQAYEYISSCYTNNLNSLKFTMRASNAYETTYYTYKVVGICTAFNGENQLSEQIIRLSPNDLKDMVKDTIYASNSLVLPIKSSMSTLINTIDYSKKNNLQVLTSSKNYSQTQAETLRKYGIPISIILLIVAAVLWGYHYYINYKNHIEQNETDKVAMIFKDSIWQNICIFMCAFVASLLISMFLNFILNISINALIGHAIIDLYITKLSFYLMLNIALFAMAIYYIVITFIIKNKSKKEKQV